MVDKPATRERINLIPAWGYLPAAADHALIRLVQAIIVHAVFEARGKGKEAEKARQWLQSEDCAYYCGFAGVNFRMLHEWVASGCPELDADEVEQSSQPSKKSSRKVPKKKSKPVHG